MRAVLTLTLRNVGKKPQLGFCIIKKIYVTSWAKTFLPRGYAECGYEIACRLSVCLSLTFRYRDHIGWNTSKVISRPNNLSLTLGLTAT